MGNKTGRTGSNKTPSWLDWCTQFGKLAGLESQGGVQSRCSCLRETPTFCKRRALAYAKHNFSILGPAGVTLEPSLAEPSWAAQSKRKLGDQKKVASRAGKTLINSARLENGGPAACRNGAPVHVKQQLFQKVRSRLRKTSTWETRLVEQAPTRHPAGWTGAHSLASWPGSSRRGMAPLSTSSAQLRVDIVL